MSENRTEGFLGRWSRLKRGEQPEEASAPVDTASDHAVDTSFDENARQVDAGRVSGDAGETAAEPPAKDFSDFDFDALSYESDYKQFMEAGVPDDVRKTALRKLWLSNPVLANVDGLDDYCEDYTDAAMCLPKGTMKTAYRFGRGFLSDAEVAQWQALGKPAEAEAAAVGDSDPVPGPEVSEADAAAVETAAATTGEPAAGSDDWPESAATSGAGCAAALKAQEFAAEMEEDAASDAEASPKPSSNT